MNPFFSIIVPTYNRVDMLPRCIESVLSQTYNDFELIIVDNYSDDGTQELINKYLKKDVRVRYFQEYNYGVIAHSRNVGIKESKGKYICFLDSDDWYTANKLETTYNLIATSNVDMVYNPLYVVSRKGVIGLLGKPLRRKNKYLELLIDGNKICNSSVVVKRSVIDSVGYISEEKELIAIEDFDYWLKVSKALYDIKYIPEPLGFYWQGDNLSYSYMQIGRIQALYDKHIINFKHNSDVIKIKFARDYRKARIMHSIKYYKDARKMYVAIFLNANLKYKFIIIFFIIQTLFHEYCPPPLKNI